MCRPCLRVRYLLNPQDFGHLILLIILMLMCAQEPPSTGCSSLFAVHRALSELVTLRMPSRK